MTEVPYSDVVVGLPYPVTDDQVEQIVDYQKCVRRDWSPTDEDALEQLVSDASTVGGDGPCAPAFGGIAMDALEACLGLNIETKTEREATLAVEVAQGVLEAAERMDSIEEALEEVQDER